jgi:hypothetical protein
MGKTSEASESAEARYHVSYSWSSLLERLEHLCLQEQQSVLTKLGRYSGR